MGVVVEHLRSAGDSISRPLQCIKGCHCPSFCLCLRSHISLRAGTLFFLDQPPSHMVYLDLRLLSLPTPDKYDSSQRSWTFRYALSLNHFSSTKYHPTDALAGPVILSIALFVAVLANFIIRGQSQFKFKNCSRLT